ncbi:hypothetical protein E4T48_00358 [Aureobasidium sp. EXF-10727]|nr:hypothetical protein E4T48_00358 [Aureobasidium sp. EXF-10727]KAI4729818.1 hypothetical protein E4T49_02411 [Aureobasidium sp. EXF-10728]
MKYLNRLSDKIARRPSSGQPADDTAQLLSSPTNTSSSPAPHHASLPYGFEWSPRPMSHGQTWMISFNTLAMSRDYKQAASMALLDKMWESREHGDVDFRIKCNGCVWKVHRAVLAANSEYFSELFSAPQPKGTYLTMIELERCDDEDDAGRIDRYNPKYIEEVLHFFYKFSITRRVQEMPASKRLLFLAKVHRTATQFRAPDVVKALTAIMGDCLPRFNGTQQQISGPTLTDFAKICRWVFDQTDFPGLVWQLKLYLIKYLKENVAFLLSSKEMCEMLRDCIFSGLNDGGTVSDSVPMNGEDSVSESAHD